MSATRSRISHNSSLVPVSISIRPSAISTTPVLVSTEVAIFSVGVIDRSQTEKALRDLLNDDHLAARLGRIDQFHLRRPIDQDGSLIDVGLVGDLASRQRWWLLKERE